MEIIKKIIVQLKSDLFKQFKRKIKKINILNFFYKYFLFLFFDIVLMNKINDEPPNLDIYWPNIKNLSHD
jgi:hypothetical protein